MSEEKMRASFQEWADKRGVWPMLTHEEIFAAGWQAALQESEAGAVYQIMSGGLWADANKEDFDYYSKQGNHSARIVYLAPPSAQAIETAAYMRAAEVADQYEKPGLADEIRSLIPQDGRTQLEQKCMEIAEEAASFGHGAWSLPTEGQLRAIVTNLIGAAK